MPRGGMQPPIGRTRARSAAPACRRVPVRLARRRDRETPVVTVRAEEGTALRCPQVPAGRQGQWRRHGGREHEFR
jgi:hypothetical protein